jgi:hypothetical protein
MATTNQQTVISTKHSASLISSLSKIAEGFNFFKKKSTAAATRGNSAANLLGSIAQHIPQIKSVFPQLKTPNQNSNQPAQIQPNPANNQPTQGQSNTAANSTVRGSIKQTVKDHITGGIKGLKHKFGTKEGLLNAASGLAGGGIMSAILKESSDKISDSKLKTARKEKFVARYLSKTEKGQELSNNLSKDDARAEALKVYEKEIELLEKINELEDEHKKLKSEGLEITEEELDNVKDLEKQKADLISGKIQKSNPQAAPTSVQPTAVTPTTVTPTAVQPTAVTPTAVQPTTVPTNTAHVSNKNIAAVNKQSRKTQKALNRASVIQKAATKILSPQLNPTAAVESQNSDAGANNGSSILRKIYSSILISNKELKKLSNYSKLQLAPTSKRPGVLNKVSNFASAAKEKGGSLLSSAMSAGSNIASAAKEKGGSLLSSAADSGIGRAATSVASRFALPALAVAGAGAAGWGVGSMISDALPNLGSDVYDLIHGEPEKEKPIAIDKQKIAARQQKDASTARSNFAKTDPRIVKPEVADDASVRSNSAKTDPLIVKPEITAREAQTTQLEQKTEEVEQVKQQNAAPIIHAPSSSPTTIINNNSTTTGVRPDIRLQEPTYTQLMSSAFRRNPYVTI